MREARWKLDRNCERYPDTRNQWLEVAGHCHRIPDKILHVGEVLEAGFSYCVVGPINGKDVEIGPHTCQYHGRTALGCAQLNINPRVMNFVGDEVNQSFSVTDGSVSSTGPRNIFQIIQIHGQKKPAPFARKPPQGRVQLMAFTSRALNTGLNGSSYVFQDLQIKNPPLSPKRRDGLGCGLGSWREMLKFATVLSDL